VNKLRILVLAPDANPESISVNLVCYRHAEALAQLHDVTLIGRACHEDALRRSQSPFRSIEAVKLPWLDRIYEWALRRVFKYNYRSNLLTAFGYPFCLAFERRAWQLMKGRIVKGEFDAVLRLSPIIFVMPSPFPFFLRNLKVPFIIGPINGGLPWPKGFSQADNQKIWIDYLRSLYQFLPFAQSTYRRAAAIIAGSSHTFAQFAKYDDKLFFVPENGISLSDCAWDRALSENRAKPELIFVGGLVPYKACDLALRAAASILQKGRAHFTIVGDGPEREHLEELARSLGIYDAVSFCGTLSHDETMQRLRSADILVFPSVREFGGGVVFEALAAGVVPLVADFGGPGDIVTPEVGYKVPLTNETDLVAQMEKVLTKLVQDQTLCRQMQEQGMSYARERLTWQAKAQDTTQVLKWAMRQGPKPNLRPPKSLTIIRGFSS